MTSDSPVVRLTSHNTPTKAIFFLFGCSEVNSTWLITSELANQHMQKVLFTSVVYTKLSYTPTISWCTLYHLHLAFILQLIELYHFVWQFIKTRDLGICLSFRSCATRPWLMQGQKLKLLRTILQVGM